MHRVTLSLVLGLSFIGIGAILPAQFTLLRSTIFFLAIMCSAAATWFAFKQANKGGLSPVRLLISVLVFLIILSFLLSQLMRLA